jgi:four helix bundle protein
MTAKPFDIKERSYNFSKEIIQFVGQSQFERIYNSLFDQVLRSGTSIGANVEEGKAGSSRRDFRKFYLIALKSANETKYWLNLIRDTNLSKVSVQKQEELITESEALSKIIASIVINLDKKTNEVTLS